MRLTDLIARTFNRSEPVVEQSTPDTDEYGEPIPGWKLEHPTWKFDHVAAGIKAAATNKQRYGLRFYNQIGGIGGRLSRGGGFQPGSDLAREAGRIGGATSRRRKAV